MWCFLAKVKSFFGIVIFVFIILTSSYLLRLKGIQKIYKFDPKCIPSKNSTLIYFISSNLTTFHRVLEQIQYIEAHQQLSPTSSAILPDLKPYHVIVLPLVLHSFEVHLEQEGLYGLVELHRFSWDFILIDSNVLSMEIPQIFREFFIEQNTSLISSIAHSLRIFNMIFKKPQLILSYGEHSEKILDMVERIEGFQIDSAATCNSSDFDAMIVMDRCKDFPSCLLTPVIYSGLLVEMFHTNAGQLHIDVANNRIKSNKLPLLQPIANTIDIKTDVTTLRLNSINDTIYAENRYKHITDVVNLLSAQAKVLGMEVRNLQGMQIHEIQDYVSKKLPKITTQKKELFKHLILCETIVNELGGQFEKLHTMEESMIYNRNKKQTYSRILENLCIDAHKYNALRHICLLHITCNLNFDEATTFMTNYLNTFGYKYLTIFSKLSTAKLFPNIDAIITKSTRLTSITKWQNQFQADAIKMKLLPESEQQNFVGTSSSSRNNTSKQDPLCLSYVFNGTYIPLVAQLAKILCECERFDDFQLKSMNFEQLKIYRYLSLIKENSKTISTTIKNNSDNNDSIIDIFANRKIKKVFIYIVGGVTYSEIAACNLVNQLTGSMIVLASNAIISGSDLIEAAVENN